MEKPTTKTPTWRERRNALIALTDSGVEDAWRRASAAALADKAPGHASEAVIGREMAAEILALREELGDERMKVAVLLTRELEAVRYHPPREVVEALAEAWRKVPIGTRVLVIRDRGDIFATETRSEPWVLGGERFPTALISLGGISGGYALTRVRLADGTVPA